MKTMEELAELKKEWESIREKLDDLSDEELELVTGGAYRELSMLKGAQRDRPTEKSHDNIAKVNTTGFKSDRKSFSDMFAQTLSEAEHPE